MTYTITKEHTFSASHTLDGLAAGHPCSRLHGHNYTIRVMVEAQVLDSVGFVIDYHDLAPFLRWVDDTVDHRHLNDLVGFNPTAENLSLWFTLVAREMLGLETTVTVAVSETPKTWALWTG